MFLFISLSLVLIILYCLGTWFFWRSLEKSNQKNNEFYKHIWFNNNLNFSSKTIKLINFKRFFLSPIIGSIITSFLWLLLLYSTIQNAEIKNVWVNYLIMGIIILIDLIGLAGLPLYAFKKRFKFEISDKQLIKEFRDFKTDWFEKFGHEKIALSFQINALNKNQGRFITNYSYKYDYKYSFTIENQLKKIKSKKSINEELLFINFFRDYLSYTRMDFSFFQKNNAIIINKNTQQIVSYEELKRIIVHNYLCMWREVNLYKCC